MAAGGWWVAMGRWLALACLLLALPARGADPGVLGWDRWVDATGQADAARVARGPTAWAPATPGLLDAGGAGTTWLRIRLVGPAAGAPAWRLELPVPLLDEVRLATPQAGQWHEQRAGDHLPVADWPRPGRFPAFDVAAGPGAQTLYLAVRHSDPITLQVHLAPAARLDVQQQHATLGLGLAFGALLVLIGWCAVQAVLHRDVHYAWYGGYALAMALTLASATGLAGLLLWPRAPGWNDAAQGLLPLLTAAIHLLFVLDLCAIAARHPRLATLVRGCAAAIVAAGAAYVWLTPAAQRWAITLAFAASQGLGMAMAVQCWRRGDRVGALVLAAYLPLATVLLLAILRLFAWLPAGWFTLDAAAAAAASAVPLLLLALHARSRFRHGVLDRVQHARAEDALTGVLSWSAFEQHLRAAVGGALMRREGAAVVLVDVANLAWIRSFLGDGAAEQSLLRTVILLNRVVRDSDPVGRVAAGRFGLVLEGRHAREGVQARMVRLVAAGLTPPVGQPDAPPLHYRVAFCLLHPHPLAAELVLRRLGAEIDAMPLRPRRPVRFVDIASQQPPTPEADEGGGHDVPAAVTDPSLATTRPA